MKTIFLFFFLFLEALAIGQAPQLVVPLGQKVEIRALTFSPDGKMLLTGAINGTGKLWDLDGKEIRTFGMHNGPVNAVAFSPDGQTVLTGSEDGAIKLWTMEGIEIRVLRSIEAICSAAFSPDGKMIMALSPNGKMTQWKLENGNPMELTGYLSKLPAVKSKKTSYSHVEDKFTAFAYSPDGKTILAGSRDGRAKLLDLNLAPLKIKSENSTSWLLGRKAMKEIKFFNHDSYVSVVAFSPEGKRVLTGGRDGVTKLWDSDGNLIQSFMGRKQPVNFVAFSPDGKTLLTGDAGGKVVLWDLHGKEIQIYSGYNGAFNAIDFSPDGQMLFIGNKDCSAKLWNIENRLLQTIPGHGRSVVGAICVSPDSKKILTSGENNTVKLWNSEKKQVITFAGHKAAVTAMSFSPANPEDITGGNTIITGSRDGMALLWDLNGKVLQTFSGHKGPINAVAFSPNGKMLLTGSDDTTAKLWRMDGTEIRTISGHEHGINTVAFSPDGTMILTGSSDCSAKMWDLEGKEIRAIYHFPWPTDNRVRSATFSPDGKTLMTLDNFGVRLWDLYGKKIRTIERRHSPASAAFSPDGKSLFTVRDYTINQLDFKGNEIRNFFNASRLVSPLAFSPNGKMVLGGTSMSAIIWDTEGREIATLIPVDSTNWVVTTPSGLFDASPGAMKLMHYVQGLEVIELEQLKERYYEPGLLAKILGFDKDELRNVANFDKLALYPEIKTGIEKDLLNITLIERTGGLGKLSLFINNKEVQEDVNPKRLKNLAVDLNTFSKYYRTETENTIALRAYNKEGWLKSQAYELPYRPTGAKGNNQPGTLTGKPASNIKPSFYAIVVGTSNYAGERLDLRFADHDAAAMSQAFQQAGSALFGAERTTVTLLSTAGKTPAESSNKTNITKAFADMAAKATPADVLVVYFSGHGLAYGDAEKAQFYYLTKDIGSEDLSDPVVRNSFTISSNELTQWLTAIPAQKQVMILDACNAGKVVESLLAAVHKGLSPSQIRALDRMKDRTGMFILTGSAADKVSYEASQYGQGLLTYSLLQGMSGLALTEDKRVDVMTLFQYSRDKVPELAKGIGGVQTPELAFPTDGSSFDIGIVNAGVKIPLAQVKPVFIRNNFTNEDGFDDNISLTDTLENYFREITTKGAQAELIFVDVKAYEDAYSMKGRYTVEGDVVAVRGLLYKGKDAQGEFQVTGKKSNMPGLAEGILDAVQEWIK